MSSIISIQQNPASSSLAQSPMIFSVNISNADMLASSSFQYMCELTYWRGSANDSGSFDYTLAKYPNESEYGIFDVSKIINSTLVEKREENSSNAVWFKSTFYPQYIPIGETAFVTGSKTSSDIFLALDGYGLFPENITSSLQDKTDYYPILTDGPSTQSFFDNNSGTFGVSTRDVVWNGDEATHIYYSSSLTSSLIPLNTSVSSSEQIQQIPAFPSEGTYGFVAAYDTFPITYTDSYTICAVSASDSSSLLPTYVSASFTSVDGDFRGGNDRFDYNAGTIEQNAHDFEEFFNSINPVYVWASDEVTPLFYNTITEESSPYAQTAITDKVNVPEIVLESPWVINNDYDNAKAPLVFSNTDLLIANSFASGSTSQYDPDITKVGQCIRFEEKCEEKYPNVRIKWKNRYGQYDYLNFDMVSREAFSTTRKTYQPQVGSWNSSTLEYNQFESSIQNYVSDSTQTISVNSDWLSEDYNELLKQLVSSDEIYWIYNDEGDVRPLAITTSNIRFKTGVVDKLIQYSFDFKFGQNYKLIL